MVPVETIGGRMKHVFRLGFFIIPFLFLFGQNAFGDAVRATASVIGTGSETGGRAHLKRIKLSDLSPMDERDRLQIQSQNTATTQASNLQSVQPYEGRGGGVQASLFHFDK
jgi:hypothetical protein